jgi:hypothetical protein
MFVIAGQYAALALRSPGAVIKDRLRAAAAELKHAPGTLPDEPSLRVIPGYFRRWRATIDSTGFPTDVTVTLHGLDQATCRDAVTRAGRIEGPVVVELERYHAVTDCGEANDMTWRLMP